MKRAVCIAGSVLALLTAAGFAPSAFVGTLAAQAKAAAPTVEVDPLWPKPFPQKNAWILGSVTGVTVEGQDHIWVVHRGVDSLQANEKGPALEPWASSCCFAAPQILEFDAAGTLLAHWEPKTGTGYDWPHDPAGIAVDDKGNVWVAGGLPASSLPAARGRGPAPAAGAAPGAARGAAPAAVGRGAAPAAAATARPRSTSRAASPSTPPPTRCTSPTASPITASRCSTRRPARSSGAGARTARSRPTPIRARTIRTARRPGSSTR